MSAILKTPMIQQMLSVMTTTQVSSLLAMMDTDQVAVNYNIGMATNGIPTTLSTNPTFATISMERFYVMKTSADTPATAELHKETKKVTGALYQPVAGTPNYSFIEFGQDICRFWAFVNGQALIVPETLSTVELRAEVLKRELENFSTAISCDAQGNVEIGRNLHIDKDLNVDGNCDASTFGKQLDVSAGSNNENVTATLDEISVTPHVSKVGNGIHAHFQLMLVVGSAYVAPAWVNIAYIEGGELQSAYQGKLLMSESQSLIDSGLGTLATYGWGIDSSGHTGNLFIDGTALTAGKTYYVDFNQTVNY